MPKKDSKPLEKEKVKKSLMGTFAAAFLSDWSERQKKRQRPNDRAAPGGLDKLYD